MGLYWSTIPLITHLNPFQLFNIIRKNNHFYAWRPFSIFRKMFFQQLHKNEAEIKANRCFSGCEVPISKLLSKRFLRLYTAISNVITWHIITTVTFGLLPHRECKLFEERGCILLTVYPQHLHLAQSRQSINNCWIRKIPTNARCIKYERCVLFL